MQNVFIINFNLLYEILDEIKENLSYKIIKFENEEDFKKVTGLDIINCLIISKTKHKLLLNKNITNKNFLDLNDVPSSLKKLLELINIKLIKLKFNYQSKIIINGYELNLNSKFFSKSSSFSNLIILKDKFSFISSRTSYNELKFIIKTFCIIISIFTYDNSCIKQKHSYN